MGCPRQAQWLSGLPALKKLNCSGVKYTPDNALEVSLPLMLQHRQPHPYPHHSMQLTWTALGKLSGLPALRKLNCSGVTQLGQLEKLESLSLQSCVRLSDLSIASLAKNLTHLSHLNLRGCLQISDTGVSHMSSLVKLEELYLKGTAFENLQDLTHLHKLSLSHCEGLSVVEHLSGLVGLQSLNLSHCSKLSISSLAKLSCLQGLTQLLVSHSKCVNSLAGHDVDAALSQMSGLRGLKELDISHFKDPQGLPQGLMQAIASMTALTCLKMVGNFSTPTNPAADASPPPSSQAVDVWVAPPSSQGPPYVQSHCESKTGSLWFVSQLDQLEELDVSGWRHASPLDLRALEGLTQMTKLRMSRFGNNLFIDEANKETSAEASGMSCDDASSDFMHSSSASQAASIFASDSHSPFMASLQEQLASITVQSQSHGTYTEYPSCMGVSQPPLSQAPLLAQASTAVPQPALDFLADQYMVDVQDGGSFIEGAFHAPLRPYPSQEPASSDTQSPVGGADRRGSLGGASLSSGSSTWTSVSDQDHEHEHNHLLCFEDHLSLEPTPLDQAMHCLSGMKLLQEIDLEACLGLTDDGVLPLSGLPNLRIINLGGCREVTGTQSFASIAAHCQHLHTLQLDDCAQICNQALVHVGKITSLQKLSLNACQQVGDEGIMALVCLHKLSTLCFGGLPMVTARSLQHLGQLRYLKRLALPCCPGVDDSGIQALLHAPSLTSLDVAHCWRVSEKALDRLKYARPMLELRGS
eukprot:gene21874-28906_t